LCSRIQTAGIEPAIGGFEGGMHPSWGAYEGAGPLRRSWRGKIQGRAGGGARFKSRRPRHVFRLASTGQEKGAKAGVSCSAPLSFWSAAEIASTPKHHFPQRLLDSKQTPGVLIRAGKGIDQCSNSV